MTCRPSQIQRRSFPQISLMLTLVVFFLLTASTLVEVQGFAHAVDPPTTSTTTTTTTTSSSSCQDILDVPRLKERIGAGRVYQHLNFLSEEEVKALWEEVRQLEDKGGFARSGLSNTVQGTNQQFGSKDRTLCPVPWWTESLEGKDDTGSTGSSSSSSSLSAGIRPVVSRIQDLRLFLANLLDRPTMTNEALAHECYYSLSTVGSFLPRHMDERHEELKGAKGWLLPSRRSLSWLIYLSDSESNSTEDWSLEENGGALRSFPPKAIVDSIEGGNLTHDQGNLQIAWLLNNNEIEGEEEVEISSKAQPVYLDSWFPVAVEPGQPPEPHCILYTRNQQQDQIFLTQPWLTEGVVVQGMSVPDFIQTWARRQSSSAEEEPGLFLRKKDAEQFQLIEDRPGWENGEDPKWSDIEDIIPQRGSLVVFDSVTLPHQVELIKKGRRVALAGWFHEETQPFPEGLYA